MFWEVSGRLDHKLDHNFPGAFLGARECAERRVGGCSMLLIHQHEQLGRLCFVISESSPGNARQRILFIEQTAHDRLPLRAPPQERR